MNIQIDKPENTDKIIDSLRPYFRCYYLKHGKPVNKDFLKNFQIVYIENNGDFDWMLKNSEILTRRYAPFILKAAVNEWKKYRFETYPHKTYIENHKVTAGKVERCDTVKLGDMHKYSRQYGYVLYQAANMDSGKILQVVYLDGIPDRQFYISWGYLAKGIQQYDIIDFEYSNVTGYNMINKRTLEGGGGNFSNARMIRINGHEYSSIRMAYSHLNPAISYSTVCQRLRRKIPAEWAFSNERFKNGIINKLGVIIK